MSTPDNKIRPLDTGTVVSRMGDAGEYLVVELDGNNIAVYDLCEVGDFPGKERKDEFTHKWTNPRYYRNMTRLMKALDERIVSKRMMEQLRQVYHDVTTI